MRVTLDPIATVSAVVSCGVPFISLATAIVVARGGAITVTLKVDTTLLRPTAVPVAVIVYTPGGVAVVVPTRSVEDDCSILLGSSTTVMPAGSAPPPPGAKLTFTAPVNPPDRVSPNVAVAVLPATTLTFGALSVYAGGGAAAVTIT